MAQGLHILAPAAFADAFSALGAAWPDGEVSFTFGPAAGDRPDSLVSRLAAGAVADLVVLPQALFQAQQQAGRIAGDVQVALAVSRTAFCLPEGAALPDLSTEGALRAALLDAGTVAISAAGSGVYFTTTLLPALGLAPDQVATLQRSDRPVAEVVAAGEATIGFQQRAELTGQPGVQVVRDLPPLAQHGTALIAGRPQTATAQASAQADAFLRFAASAAGVAVLDRFGLDT